MFTGQNNTKVHEEHGTIGQTSRVRERRWRITRTVEAPVLICPPSSAPWVILSTVVTETMAEHAMVLAKSVKV